MTTAPGHVLVDSDRDVVVSPVVLLLNVSPPAFPRQVRPYMDLVHAEEQTKDVTACSCHGEMTTVRPLSLPCTTPHHMRAHRTSIVSWLWSLLPRISPRQCHLFYFIHLCAKSWAT
jgi:hypothetical protein